MKKKIQVFFTFQMILSNFQNFFFGGGGGAIDGSLHLSTAAPKGAYAFKTNTNFESGQKMHLVGSIKPPLVPSVSLLYLCWF